MKKDVQKLVFLLAIVILTSEIYVHGGLCYLGITKTVRKVIIS